MWNGGDAAFLYEKISDLFMSSLKFCVEPGIVLHLLLFQTQSCIVFCLLYFDSFGTRMLKNIIIFQQFSISCFFEFH